MNFWSDATIERLRAGIVAGESYGEIAKAIGCSRSAAIGKANRLGLVGGRAAAPIRIPLITAPWSADEDRKVADGIAAGKSIRTLAAELGRGPAATKKRVGTLGLSRPASAPKPKPAATAAKPGQSGGAMRLARPRRDVVVDTGAPDPTGHVRFMDRRAFQCAWIVDAEAPIIERMVCGASTSGLTSWCAHHRLICRETPRAVA